MRKYLYENKALELLLEMEHSGGESTMGKKKCFLLYVSGFACIRETVTLIRPQNVTEKYQSETHLGSCKVSG